MQINLKIFCAGSDFEYFDALVGRGLAKRVPNLQAIETTDCQELLDRLPFAAPGTFLHILVAYNDDEARICPAFQIRARRLMRLTTAREDRLISSMRDVDTKQGTRLRVLARPITSKKLPKGHDFAGLGELGVLGYLVSEDLAAWLEEEGTCGASCLPVLDDTGIRRDDCALLSSEDVLPPGRLSNGSEAGIVEFHSGGRKITRHIGSLVYPSDTIFRGIQRTREDFWDDNIGDWIVDASTRERLDRAAFKGIWYEPVLLEGSPLQIELDRRLHQLVASFAGTNLRLY